VKLAIGTRRSLLTLELSAGYARPSHPIWVWSRTDILGKFWRVAGGRFSTIVIVEESPAVQELFEQSLREVGACVLVTQNALEVLDVARRVRIDLLVVDIDSEPGLVEEVRTSQPGLQVLYLSDNSDEQQAVVEPSSLLLTPFSLGELRVTIAALLEGAGPAPSGGGGTQL
jgi:DNA-binding response OmpR family regulator